MDIPKHLSNFAKTWLTGQQNGDTIYSVTYKGTERIELKASELQAAAAEIVTLRKHLKLALLWTDPENDVGEFREEAEKYISRISEKETP